MSCVYSLYNKDLTLIIDNIKISLENRTVMIYNDNDL